MSGATLRSVRGWGRTSSFPDSPFSTDAGQHRSTMHRFETIVAATQHGASCAVKGGPVIAIIGHTDCEVKPRCCKCSNAFAPPAWTARKCPRKRAYWNGRTNFQTVFSDLPKDGWWQAFGLFGAVTARGCFCGLPAALLSP